MKRRGNGRRLSVAISLAAGAALLLLVLRSPSPADPVAAVPPPVPAPETADRPDAPPKPVSLAAVALPAPPPIVAERAEVKPLPARMPPPVVEMHVLQPTSPAPKEPPREIVPLPPKAAETPPPAPMPEPRREIVPLQARHEIPAEAPVQEIRPIKASVPAESVEPLHPRSPENRETARLADAPEPSAAEPATVHVSVETGGAVAQEGRALLRLLEHGSGPTIEIAWPSGAGQQTRLYQALARCYGMRSIVMDGQGNLYLAEGARGHKWDLNLDRFSGFVRQPNGFVAPEERGAASAIRRYHALNGSAGVVRIFPRGVDAVLLGGLQKILGDAYRGARTIHALYRLEGNRLFVENIERDGVTVDGRIAFASLSRGSCGG